jgi:hypothetical protein
MVIIFIHGSKHALMTSMSFTFAVAMASMSFTFTFAMASSFLAFSSLFARSTFRGAFLIADTNAIASAFSFFFTFVFLSLLRPVFFLAF